jgi:hypothetical protein
LAQNGQNFARHIQNAEHVRVELLPDLFTARFFNRADKGVTGVIDKDVNAPEFPDGFPNRAFSVLRIRHVELDRPRRVGIFINQIL